MAKVVITSALQKEVLSKFKAESVQIFLKMKQLESKPTKGKAVGNVGGIIIKEIRYEKFRFYFITDGHILKFGSVNELANLLIKFVKISEKKDQQKTINAVKRTLKLMGFEGF